MKIMPLSVFLFISVIATSISSHTNANPSLELQSNQTFSKTIADNKRLLARQFADSYATANLALKQHINHRDLSVSADKIYQTNKKLLNRSNQMIRIAKGLNPSGENLIQLRIASKKMITAWHNGSDPLFAFSPEGDEKQWTGIEAFDTDGNVHFLDVYTLPTRPVFIVELDGRKALREGLEVMRNLFSARDAELSRSNILETGFTEPLSTTVLKHIRLENDEEPWILGKAEVYAVTNGISPSRDEPVLDVIDMPYLDHDGVDYYPNQILFFWDRYRWQAADAILMEHDDNTNFKEIAINLLEIAAQILQSIPSPDVQGYAIIAIITNGILEALPDQWFINNDDYVDSFYTTFENQEYTNHRGARNNATVTLKPLIIDAR
ncbi:DUF3103 family protein [Microbulbifer sp. TYP-18]|uniref:DUF3103 family protein n=1 Tax=Microbulbifer sp. TYP-18 TaxID=3230024 RepID=UPI0034C5B4DB